MSTSTGRDRHDAMAADMAGIQGYPVAEPDGDSLATQQKQVKELTTLGQVVVWGLILSILGPPFVIGLIRLNQWLWSL